MGPAMWAKLWLLRAGSGEWVAGAARLARACGIGWWAATHAHDSPYSRFGGTGSRGEPLPALAGCDGEAGLAAPGR